MIHTAAKVDIWGDGAAFEAINIEGTRRLLEAARQAGASRFVYTSSPSVTFDGSDAEHAGPELGYPERFLAHYPRNQGRRRAPSRSRRTPLISAPARFALT